ncbi:MAG TPA: flavin reductase [Saprospirales bacterium]|nr:flavin reductase [Saprospirales bacterium]HAY71483.1 flavin reductase [Saprospirales bacterium]
MRKNIYKTIDPGQISVGAFHQYLLGAVIPRPIALAGTVDKAGRFNLSPFSFFNVFGANPPIMIFSPSRRVRDNTDKHTLENVREIAEVMIHMVDYDMVEQMSLSSTEYDKGINEYIKAGFQAKPGDLIRPLRIIGAPVAFECKVINVIETGSEGGSGNLVVSEVLRMHIREDLLDENDMIDPVEMDVVCRLGGDWYGRINSENLFEIPKPIRSKGIGFDQLPDFIMNSHMFTGNQLARLANVEALPSKEYLDGLNHTFKQIEKEGADMKTRNHVLMRWVYECIEQNEAMKALALLYLGHASGMLEV